MPKEPPSSTFSFPSRAALLEQPDVVIANMETPTKKIYITGKMVVGGDYEPGTLLSGYRSGLYMSTTPDGKQSWLSPDPRAVFNLDQVHISHSLQRARRRFAIKVDTAFELVTRKCAERAEGEYVWLTPQIQDAMVRLHSLGWAHSVEAWTLPDEEAPAMLVGGLYGVAIGGLFCGESMFNTQRDASKVAFAALVDILRDGEDGRGRLIDVQMYSPHMFALGATDISRDEYLERLDKVLKLPLPSAFAQ